MFTDLTLQTHRLSPKHQVTLPKDARALATCADSGVVCALPHRLALRDGTPLPVLVLLPEPELRARETAIRERTDIDAAAKERRIARLNGHARMLAIDSHRRVVLPAHFLELLKIDRDIYMYSNNETLLVWNPQDWLRYSADEDDNEDSGDLLI